MALKEDSSNVSSILLGLKSFLRDSCGILLNLRGDLSVLDAALEKDDETLLKFITDGDTNTLFAEFRSSSSFSTTATSGKDGDQDRDGGLVTFGLRLSSHSHGHGGGDVDSSPESSAAFIKRHEGKLVDSTLMSNQLQMLTLGGGGGGNKSEGSLSSNSSTSATTSLLATIQRFTRQAFTPLVMAVSSSADHNNNPCNTNPNTNQSAGVGGGGDDDTGTGMNSLLRKLHELDSALEQCQRGSMIVKVNFSLPEYLENVLASALAARRSEFKGDDNLNSLTEGLLSCLEKFSLSSQGSVDEILENLKIESLLGRNAEEKDKILKDVNEHTKLWPAEISRQIKLVENPFLGSVEREIEFWNTIHEHLVDTKDKLIQPAVLLTKLVLKRTNRVSESLIKEAEGALDKSIEVVQVSTSFLKDFPIAQLMSSTSFHPQLSKSVSICLQHFSKIRYSKFDLSRTVNLLEALGNSFFSKSVTMLKEQNLLQISIQDFRSIKDDLDQVFIAWDTHYAQQLTVLNEVAKRRREKLVRLHFKHVALRQHLNLVAEFREQHERLLGVFSVVFADQESKVIGDLADAYKLFLQSVTDVVDTGPQGQTAWTSARQMYEKKLERTEERIIVLLDDRLSHANSAEEMFRVFSTFNQLFFRPAIRNAVNSYRITLVKNVREDVKRLQDKFRFRYEESQEKTMADLRGIPPLSGRIIWARQIENQLSRLMKRMEDVLGHGWEEHFEGKQLKEVCDELRKYLDTEQLYKAWKEKQLKAEDMKKYNQFKDFLLLIVEDHTSGLKKIQVNFEDKQTVLFQEVRHLEWLLPGMSTSSKSIPATIRSLSKEAQMRYPAAMALQAGLATFARAKKDLCDEDSKLLVSYIEPIREMVKEAIGGGGIKRWVKWDAKEIHI